ncbi:hypothetical protein KPH14_012544 [Odynerus spinipes]|uniref:Uncharacterized protein n=1 Tax=Odynerus spinipes TaxID=1348599 RepID=A0AAD9RIG3_9HYME|nr:hypothetical protein KPH14_012544 [Odynerus spinipes]
MSIKNGEEETKKKKKKESARRHRTDGRRAGQWQWWQTRGGTKEDEVGGNLTPGRIEVSLLLFFRVHQEGSETHQKGVSPERTQLGDKI